MNAARHTCTHTISDGSLVLYWMRPIVPWAAMRQQRSVIERSARAFPRRRTRIQTMTAAKPRIVAMRPCWCTTQLSVSVPRHSRRSITSPVPAPPAWGPDAVAAVPRNTVAAPSGTSARTAQTVTRSVDRGRLPGSWRERQSSATAAVSSSIDRM